MNDETGIFSTKQIETDCPKETVSSENFCPTVEQNGPKPLSMLQLKNAFVGLAIGYLGPML